MNIAPSFLNELRITAIVEFDPGPEAFMIRDFSTSAGEQIVVATVPYIRVSILVIEHDRNDPHRRERSREMAIDVILETMF